MIELIIAITGVLLSILIPLTRYIYGRRRRLKVYYETMWQKSSKLKPDEILGIRGGHGFDEYYYRRPVDEIVKGKIEGNQNVLVVGGPLAGKSRAIWQALTTLSKSYDVIIPKPVDINPEDFHIPFRFAFWRKPILVLDDIDRFAERRNFTHLLQEFLEYKTIIVASCRSGPEYDKLKTMMETELLSVFGDPIHIPEIPTAEAEKIADFAKRKLPATFDGNVGSIFMQLDAMKERYQHCSATEKGILRSISRLQAAGFDAEQVGFFQIEEIKHVCINREEINLKEYEWVEWLKELEKKGFIEVVGAEVRVEMAYFTGGVIEARYDTLQNLNDMMELFPNDFKKLASVGFKAYMWGNFLYKAIDYVERTEKGKGYSARSFDHLRSFYKTAINAFEKALKKWPTEHLHSSYYPMVHYNLGLVHVILASLEPENRTEHCKEATKAYDEVLRISRSAGITETHIHRYSLLGANLKEYLDFCKDQPKAKDETEGRTYIS